jgi:hypothetical protein
MLGAAGIAAMALAAGGSMLPASALVVPHPVGEAPSAGTVPLPMVTSATPMKMGGGSDGGNASLTSDIAAARVATAKYVTNLAKAKADGYMIITKMMPNMGFHFLNPKITTFDVTKPDILVYEHAGNKWQLGALEWVFPKMPKNPPASCCPAGARSSTTPGAGPASSAAPPATTAPPRASTASGSARPDPLKVRAFAIAPGRRQAGP